MRIIILGAGIVGFQIAQHLVNEGKDVVLIEKDSERARFVSNHLDCIVLNEEGNSKLTLERAGIENADFFISVTNSDEVNIIACSIVASEYNVPVKVARVRNLEYSTDSFLNKTFLGVDHIVNSEVETARALSDSVQYGAMGGVLTFRNTDLQMRNFPIGVNSYFATKTLEEIRRSLKEDFLIAGIFRGERFIIPSGTTTVLPHDTLYCMAQKKSFDRIMKKTGTVTKKIEKIAIVGGGRIGTLLTKNLLNTGTDITIIENDYEKCKVLAEQFPDVLVLNVDISDEDVFLDQNLHNHDLLVTTTNNQELNILTAAYARSLGTRRTISLVTKTNYLPIAANLGIDTTISPKISTVDAILKFVRKGNIRSVHSIFDGIAEVIEFYIEGNSRIVGRRIMNVNLPSNTLLLSVVRANQSYIPDGNFMVAPGDTVIVISRKISIPQLEELFAG